jgi:hypothetical protein
MDEKWELERVRQRVKLLEDLIDNHTMLLYENPGDVAAMATELRRAAGLPPRPRKSAE